MSEDNLARLFGAILLTGMLWLMLAIPYAFVYVVPPPLQLWLGCAAVVSTVVFVADWVVARRNR